MTAEEARTFVVSALRGSNVTTLRDLGLTHQFLIGEFDIALADVEMDSLAVMEFCISIEVNTGISILPDDLIEFGSLQEVALAIHEKSNV